MRSADAKIALTEITNILSSGQIEEGKAKLLNASPAWPEVLRLEGYGNLAFYERKFQKAIEFYEKSIEIDQGNLIARYQYLVGVDLAKETTVVPAFERFQFAIEIEPTFVDPYVELGALLVRIEDFEGARECYRRAAEIEDSFENWANLKTVTELLSNSDPEKYEREL
ncbi:hypothetical protein, partial [Novosphingobium sp.]|uniref:hypothetical protein n=1 Tax=Novosphingobium sp. TaxID=1874826 RepID=UPI003C7BD2ED